MGTEGSGIHKEKTATVRHTVPGDVAHVEQPPLHYRDNPFQPGERFDGTKEVRKILRHTSHSKRREALTDGKEKLAFKLERLAEIQDKLEEYIRQRPDESLDTYMQLFLQEAEEVGVAVEERNYARDVLVGYVQLHAAIKSVHEKYAPNVAALFKDLFGKLPVGKIDMEEGPMTIMFRAHDPLDYEQMVYSGYTEEQMQRFGLKERVARSGGMSMSHAALPELAGAVIISRNFTPKVNAEILVHEEQHAINRLFDRARARQAFRGSSAESHLSEELALASTEMEQSRALIKYFRQWRTTTCDRRVADEILAYTRDGTSFVQMTKTLSRAQAEGGLYDYLAQNTSMLDAQVTHISEWGSLDRALVQNAFNAVYVAEYKRVYEAGINALYALCAHGSEVTTAIAELRTVPLARWGAYVRRHIISAPQTHLRVGAQTQSVRETHRAHVAHTAEKKADALVAQEAFRSLGPTMRRRAFMDAFGTLEVETEHARTIQAIIDTIQEKMNVRGVRNQSGENESPEVILKRLRRMEDGYGPDAGYDPDDFVGVWKGLLPALARLARERGKTQSRETYKGRERVLRDAFADLDTIARNAKDFDELYAYIRDVARKLPDDALRTSGASVSPLKILTSLHLHRQTIEAAIKNKTPKNIPAYLTEGIWVGLKPFFERP